MPAEASRNSYLSICLLRLTSVKNGWVFVIFDIQKQQIKIK